MLVISSFKTYIGMPRADPLDLATLDCLMVSHTEPNRSGLFQEVFRAGLPRSQIFRAKVAIQFFREYGALALQIPDSQTRRISWILGLIALAYLGCQITY